MPGRLDLKEGASAHSGAEADQQLGEDRDRVSLGLWFEPSDDLAEQAVVDGRSGRRRPTVRGGQQVAVRPACRRLGSGVVEQRADGDGSFGLHLGDRGAGGGLVDDRLAVGECRDERLHGEVVDQPREAA